MAALGYGGQISEMDEACKPLLEASKRMDASAQEEWFDRWTTRRSRSLLLMPSIQVGSSDLL